MDFLAFAKNIADRVEAQSARAKVPVAAGSAQGLLMIVSDIEAARAALLHRGIKISEPFHDPGGAKMREVLQRRRFSASRE